MRRLVLPVVLIAFASVCAVTNAQSATPTPDKGADTAKVAKKTKKPAKKSTKTASQKKGKKATAANK